MGDKPVRRLPFPTSFTELLSNRDTSARQKSKIKDAKTRRKSIAKKIRTRQRLEPDNTDWARQARKLMNLATEVVHQESRLLERDFRQMQSSSAYVRARATPPMTPLTNNSSCPVLSSTSSREDAGSDLDLFNSLSNDPSTTSSQELQESPEDDRGPEGFVGLSWLPLTATVSSSPPAHRQNSDVNRGTSDGSESRRTNNGSQNESAAELRRNLAKDLRAKYKRLGLSQDGSQTSGEPPTGQNKGKGGARDNDQGQGKEREH